MDNYIGPTLNAPYASSNRFIRTSCSHSAGLMVTSTVNMKTGQIVCYKTGHIISSLQRTNASLTTL